MTNERKQQIRKDCEAEAELAMPIYENSDVDKRLISWENAERRVYKNGYAAALYLSRIKAEELIEALKECKAVLTMHTSISTRRPTQQEYESAMNTAFDALAKYRTP